MDYGNIQVEIESLWDSYTLAGSDMEREYILAEMERLYAILRDAESEMVPEPV